MARELEHTQVSRMASREQAPSERLRAGRGSTPTAIDEMLYVRPEPTGASVEDELIGVTEGGGGPPPSFGVSRPRTEPSKVRGPAALARS